MRKALRIIIGILVIGLALHGATLAQRDCRVAPYVFDDCMWISLRDHLGLPNSRFLRMGIMEFVGIVLATVIYIAIRYIFPFRKPRTPASDADSNFSPASSQNQNL